MTKSFSEIVDDSYQENHVLIVDALNLAFRWKHSGALEFVDDYIKTVNSLAQSYKASKIIIASDSGNSSFRKNILETYKGARKEKFAEQTEAERLEFELFFQEFNRTIEALMNNPKYTVFRFDKTEADDIAAYIVKNRKKFGYSTIWMASSDKDWDLLVSKGVSRFSYVTRKEITIDNWNEHYDWSQDEHISIKCLQGDSGDSVPGVPGVGPKRAFDLVRSYGSAMDIAESIPLPGKQKFIQAVNDFGAEGIYRNYQLMDLLSYCDEAIGEKNCKIIDSVLTGTY